MNEAISASQEHTFAADTESLHLSNDMKKPFGNVRLQHCEQEVEVNSAGSSLTVARSIRRENCSSKPVGLRPCREIRPWRRQKTVRCLLSHQQRDASLSRWLALPDSTDRLGKH